MRMMAKINIPVEAGNAGVADGALPKVIGEMAERWKPEAMYFTTFDGERTADIPIFAEPIFNALKARLVFAPAMNLEDLQKGLSGS